jgi:beta-mannosidase
MDYQLKTMNKSNHKKLFCIIMCITMALLCSPVAANPVSLNGQWTLHFWPQPETPVSSPDAMHSVSYQTIPAKVPGNVELDLLAAGLINDPMTGANVWEMRPYEGYQWCYARKFPTPERRQEQKVFLWFGGIDCLADIWLNGTKVGSTENMLIEHSFDVTGLLEKRKDNELQVIIRSAVIEAQNYPVSPLVIKSTGTANVESIHIRKAPHMYGWDILPRLVSAGLWRSVELRMADPVRFTAVHWMTAKTDVAKRRAEMIVDYQLKIPFDRLNKCQAIITMKRNGKEVYRRQWRIITFAARQMFN